MRACWLKWVGRDWSISADYIWLNYSDANTDARQRWFLKGFFKESDPMLVSFEYLPCRVRFAEDPSELVFDYRLPIRSNIDHILGDEENLTRIPASLMGGGQLATAAPRL